ncbi:transcriptional regulator [Leuconostoc gelidum subsp. gelidum]|nr:transcriptional regulator [Leuconostoc gelidum subsp. gelidum]
MCLQRKQKVVSLFCIKNKYFRGLKLKKEMLAELSDVFLRIVNRYNEIEKTPFAYGTDTQLHVSEVHTIEMIGNKPNINVTRLALMQGITKGAVSKRIQNLRNRGLVNKAISPVTENEVVITLTDKGNQVFQAHQRYSKELNKSIAQIYTGLPDEILNDLEKVGNDTEQLFIKILEERKESAE